MKKQSLLIKNCSPLSKSPSPFSFRIHDSFGCVSQINWSQTYVNLTILEKAIYIPLSLFDRLNLSSQWRQRIRVFKEGRQDTTFLRQFWRQRRPKKTSYWSNCQLPCRLVEKLLGHVNTEINHYMPASWRLPTLHLSLSTLSSYFSLIFKIHKPLCYPSAYKRVSPYEKCKPIHLWRLFAFAAKRNQGISILKWLPFESTYLKHCWKIKALPQV